MNASRGNQPDIPVLLFFAAHGYLGFVAIDTLASNDVAMPAT